ncbi:MAG: type II toxin-antitoxin system Phd/YefM family antitoxin [Chloroflexi bacterium]|nr:type II toxin-antitoxin system Phd/YefM family antitoxin [Chloroflexota bacterium]
MGTLFADQIVSVTELRRNLPAYLDTVRSGRPLSIMQGNRADVAIVRREDMVRAFEEAEEAKKLVAELESWIETYEILADEAFMAGIQGSEEDIAQGRCITLEGLKAELGL